jgi:WD40 repeat protein
MGPSNRNKCVLALEGHVKPILGISFSPNGYHLATGGEDNTCRIWDIRKKKSLYTIPAHSNLISQVKFEPHEGYFLVTASHTTRKLVISDGIFGWITFCLKSFLHFEQIWDGFKIQIFSSQIRP